MKFLLLIRRDRDAAALALAAGSAGVQDQREAAAAYGGTVDACVDLLGHYDVMMVVEFPSTSACYAFTRSMGAAGQTIETMLVVDEREREAARALTMDVVEKHTLSWGEAQASAKKDS